MHIAIIDDEKIHVDFHSSMVTEWAKKRRYPVRISSFENAESYWFAWCGDKSFDILLLDIQMGHADGILLAKEIRRNIGGEAVQIVFITGYPEYVSEGYEVSALHYLIKPVSEAKLFEVLDKAYKNLNKVERHILLDIEGDTIRIAVGDIICAEAFAHKVTLLIKGGSYEVKFSITQMEKQLGEGFIRCHRSYLVGLKYVKRITRTDVILDNDKAIPLSRCLYNDVNNAFIQYFRSEN